GRSPSTPPSRRTRPPRRSSSLPPTRSSSPALTAPSANRGTSSSRSASTPPRGTSAPCGTTRSASAPRPPGRALCGSRRLVLAGWATTRARSPSPPTVSTTDTRRPKGSNHGPTYVRSWLPGDRHHRRRGRVRYRQRPVPQPQQADPEQARFRFQVGEKHPRPAHRHLLRLRPYRRREGRRPVRPIRRRRPRRLLVADRRSRPGHRRRTDPGKVQHQHLHDRRLRRRRVGMVDPGRHRRRRPAHPADTVKGPAMAEGAGIRVEGIAQLVRSLRRVSERFPKELKRIHKELADPIADKAKSRVRSRTGRLAASIRPQAGQRYARVAAGRRGLDRRTGYNYAA